MIVSTRSYDERVFLQTLRALERSNEIKVSTHLLDCEAFITSIKSCETLPTPDDKSIKNAIKCFLDNNNNSLGLLEISLIIHDIVMEMIIQNPYVCNIKM